MALNLPRVRPGDLITATHWNAVLEALDQIDDALDALGGGGLPTGPPVITGFQPTEQPPIGSELFILGSGFGDQSENLVLVASQPALILGGGGTQLHVQVPPVPGVPVGGLQTQLTVSNPRGFASRAIRVMPAIINLPEGQLAATLSQSPPGPLNAGAAHVFVFSVGASVNVAETYNLSPQLTAASLPNQWQVQVRDMADQPITSITIPAANPPSVETRQVRVRVTIPAGAANASAASLSLTVRSQRNTNLVTTSPTFNFAVGGAPPQPEQLTITRAPGNPTNGTVDPDGTIVARPNPAPGQQTRVTYSVTGVQPNLSYTIDLGVIPAGWTASVAEGNNVNASPTGSLSFRVDYRPSVAGAAVVTFNLRVSRTGDPSIFGTRAQAVRGQ